MSLQNICNVVKGVACIPNLLFSTKIFFLKKVAHIKISFKVAAFSHLKMNLFIILFS